MISYNNEDNIIVMAAFPISDHLDFKSADAPYPLTTFHFGQGVYHTTSLYQNDGIKYYYPMISLFITAFKPRDDMGESMIIEYYKRLAYMLVLLGEKTICLA